ncbi:hypothetical protein ACJX0J_034830 [Zea mays]
MDLIEDHGLAVVASGLVDVSARAAVVYKGTMEASIFNHIMTLDELQELLDSLVRGSAFMYSLLLTEYNLGLKEVRDKKKLRLLLYIVALGVVFQDDLPKYFKKNTRYICVCLV